MSAARDKPRLAIHERKRPNAPPVWDVMQYHPEPHHTAWSLIAVFYDRGAVEAYAAATGAEMPSDPFHADEAAPDPEGPEEDAPAADRLAPPPGAGKPYTKRQLDGMEADFRKHGYRGRR